MKRIDWTRCPSRDVLELYLQEQLIDAAREPVDAHIEDCESCQRTLEQIHRTELPTELDEALRTRVAAMPSPPRIPDIDLIEVIGHGNSGRVWKGRLKKAQQLVAVKIILGGAHADREHQERFQREVAILSRLQHPNLVRLFHAGSIADGDYFSMEYLPAGSILDARVRFAARRELPPWSVPQIASMVRDVARAIHYSHENNVLHRDLKPGNILLAEGDVPKVADFSLGKLLDGPTRTTVGPAGTPCYMAPEQVRGEAATVRTDVYGLGALLYDWLTGQPPIAASETHTGTMQRVLDVTPVAIRSLRPDVPVDLEQIVFKCLQKDASDRYPSAKDVADDLQRFLEHQPILARPPSYLRRTHQWVRRNPVVASLLTLLTVSVVVGLCATTILWRQADAKAREAQAATQAALTSRNAAREALVLYSAGAERLYRTGTGITTEDRKALAQAATQTLDQLEADGDDPEQEFQMAWSTLKLAEAMHNMGEFETGEKLTARVVLVLRRLTLHTDDRRKIHDLAQAEAAHANLLFRAGRQEEAIALNQVAEQRVAKLFEQFPELYGYQITLASMRWHQGQFFNEMRRRPETLRCYEASLNDMRKLLRRLPTNPDRLREFQFVSYLYADALFADPQQREQALSVMQESVAELERSRKTAPPGWLTTIGSPESYLLLAFIQYRQGRMDQARAAIQQHVEFTREYHRANPELPSAVIWHGGALSLLGELEWSSNPQLGRKQFREAFGILKDAIQKRPTTEVYFSASASLTHCSDPTLRDPKLAIQYVRQAEQLDPKDARIVPYLAAALVANGQHTEALALPRSPLPMADDHWPDAQVTYALTLCDALFQSGQVPAARELLNRIASAMDRDLTLSDWTILGRYDRLRKQVLGIEPPASGTPR